MVSAVLVYVRFRLGVVGESRRTVHLAYLLEKAHAGVFVALCGQRFVPGEAELLGEISGQPCFPCLQLSPGPDDPGESEDLPEVLGPRPPLTDLFRVSA